MGSIFLINLSDTYVVMFRVPQEVAVGLMKGIPEVWVIFARFLIVDKESRFEFEFRSTFLEIWRSVQVHLCKCPRAVVLKHVFQVLMIQKDTVC